MRSTFFLRTTVVGVMLLCISNVVMGQGSWSDDERATEQGEGEGGPGQWAWMASKKYWEMNGMLGRDPWKGGELWSPPAWSIEVGKADSSFCGDVRSLLKVLPQAPCPGHRIERIIHFHHENQHSV